jgi:hypothetical protein
MNQNRNFFMILTSSAHSDARSFSNPGPNGPLTVVAEERFGPPEGVRRTARRR